ncbi:MAG: hypothetical protein M0Z52_11670 [Actinomycetota bacterium]|nr:hypothetical protein [Actinomycetota bacterium]
MADFLKKQKAHAAILCLFLLLLALPGALAAARFVFERPSTSTLPTAKSWLAGTFQAGFSKGFGGGFPFRRQYILFCDQLYYWLFKKSYMENIVIGKQDWLYELDYIKDYCNLMPAMSADNANNLAKEIALVKSLFKKRGVAFLVLISPSKASVYPEYIPDEFMERKTGAQRDYDIMTALFRQYGIDYVDGARITRNAKMGISLPLFCRGGTHWNYLGASYTVRELVNEVGRLKGMRLANISWDGIRVSSRPEDGDGSDRDLADGLNLAMPPYNYKVPYPDFKTVLPGGKISRCSIAMVGDSFSHIVLVLLNLAHSFSSIDFYYYYRRDLWTFPQDIARETEFRAQAIDHRTQTIDWDRDFFSKDAVLLEINEAAFSSPYIKAFLDDAVKHLSTEAPSPLNHGHRP